jgi:uncharacterized protein (TIGR00369 family)
MSELRQRIEVSFARQGMMQHLGAELIEASDGRVVFALPMSDRVTQQQGAFHGGAISALADICCGYAALTQAPEGMEVTSVEFKINFVRAAVGQRIRCVGEVIKAGRTLAVTRAEVFDESNGEAKTCAVMQATMIYVAKIY